MSQLKIELNIFRWYLAMRANMKIQIYFDVSFVCSENEARISHDFRYFHSKILKTSLILSNGRMYYFLFGIIKKLQRDEIWSTSSGNYLKALHDRQKTDTNKRSINLPGNVVYAFKTMKWRIYVFISAFCLNILWFGVNTNIITYVVRKYNFDYLFSLVFFFFSFLYGWGHFESFVFALFSFSVTIFRLL